MTKLPMTLLPIPECFTVTGDLCIDLSSLITKAWNLESLPPQVPVRAPDREQGGEVAPVPLR